MDFKFNDERLLKQALTHSSYAYEKKLKAIKDNEKLEFLGDSVLGFSVTSFMYDNFPQMTEGDLTKFRAKVVCEANLAMAARSINLGDYIRLGRGEERTGGHDRDSILSDAFEALLGAIYLDAGFDAARDFAINILKDSIISLSKSFHMGDFKTRLQEHVQKSSVVAVEYILVGQVGPDHDKLFTVNVMHEGKELGRGNGKSKKDAEQMAASAALELLE